MVMILHGSALEDALLLWGEVPADEQSLLTQPQQMSRALHPVALPTGAQAHMVASVLAEAVPDLAAGTLPREQAIAWLPSADGVLVPSSPLIAERPEVPTQVALLPWRLEVLRLDTPATLLLLCHCSGQTTLRPGVIIGSDVQFWVQALRFAGALVARQQYLPDVQLEGTTYRACWRPFLQSQEDQQLRQLAQAMPAACRALGQQSTEPPTRSAQATLRQFVATQVDALVRASAQAPTAGIVAQQARQRPSFASLHDQWLAALRTPDGHLVGDPQELATLATQVREWQRPLTRSQGLPFRLCFRLEAPGESPETDGAHEDSVWYVRYLLQSTQDPSLLIPLSEVWQRSQRRALQRLVGAPREQVLAELGRASGLAPEIEASLKTAHPWGYPLDVTGAHTFLTEQAWLLEQAGFGLLLPAWWTRTGTKRKLAAHAKVKSPAMSGSGLTMESLVAFEWEIALGDERLSYQELQALARLKAPLVQIRGQWVEVRAEDIQAALAFWSKQTTKTGTLRQVVQLALGQQDSLDGLPVERVQADGWIAEFLARLEGQVALAPIPVPTAFQGTLRPYQERGFAWLQFLTQWGLGPCLADDMGLGKTIETLALIQHDWLKQGKQPVLLICPTSVMENWRREAARFTPDLPLLIHHGATRQKKETFQQEAARQAIVVSSYALLHRDLDLFKQVSWRGVILDEAQNIKNPETKQAKAARAIPAAYRLALTGTPVENHVGDLWSIMEFLNPGLLGTPTAFKRQFWVPIQVTRDATATARLKQLTGPFLLRRLKTDPTIISDLPEKLEMKVFCTLTKEQASLYEAVLKELETGLDEAEGIQRKGIILGTLTKLKQVCNHPAHFLGDQSALAGRSGKLARLEAMLEEALAEGDRALIFTQFAEMGALLKDYLQGVFGQEVLFLHGQVPRKQRDRMIERFQHDTAGPAIFILSLKAGGTGLNLTRANHVFHFDRWWNPAVENQATDRAFRIGQQRVVQVHKLLCAGTLEEQIDTLIEHKQGIAANVVGTGEGWLTELSTAQLKDILALRRAAVED
jgi:SNF2 family DNA or RNA helicase